MILFLFLGWVYCQNVTTTDIVIPSTTTSIAMTLTEITTTTTTTLPSITEQPTSVSMPLETIDEVVTNTMGVIVTSRVIVQPTKVPEVQQQQDQGLSGGAKAGLIIGGVAILAAAVGIYAFRTFGLQSSEKFRNRLKKGMQKDTVEQPIEMNPWRQEPQGNQDGYYGQSYQNSYQNQQQNPYQNSATGSDIYIVSSK
jgi:hypothetical protein